jgi:hypothetical protein
MPLIDYKYSVTGCRSAALGQNEYNAQGSSMSAPQVAGAAALYRAHCPSATAQETRAALLLSSIDPRLLVSGAHVSRNTYIDRNAVGAGYTRDDLLARFAKRLDNAVGQSVTVIQAQPSTITWSVSAGLHAVAIAWPRTYAEGFDPADDVPVSWANVDLEVLDSAGVVIARCDSPRNTYERLVFRVPEATSVTLRVLGVDLPFGSVPVFVAARRIQDDVFSQLSFVSRYSHSGFVKTLAQESGCTAQVQDQSIGPVIPATYTQAYGSAPLWMSLTPPQSNESYSRSHLAGVGEWRTDNVYSPTVLGTPPGGLTIRGLALRTWDALGGCTATLTINQVWLYMPVRTGDPPPPITSYVQGVGTSPPVFSGPDNGVQVVNNVNVSVRAPTWGARNWDTWPIIIPFATPYTLLQGRHLGVWMSVAAAPCWYGVDGIDDGVGDYASETTAWPKINGVGRPCT